MVAEYESLIRKLRFSGKAGYGLNQNEVLLVIEHYQMTQILKRSVAELERILDISGKERDEQALRTEKVRQDLIAWFYRNEKQLTNTEV